MGALTVQARDAAAKMLAQAGVPMAGIAGMGYFTPGAVINKSARVGPNRNITNNGVAAYLPPGRTPLLNGVGQRVGGGVAAYLPPGRTPLLNAARAPAANREGYRYR